MLACRKSEEFLEKKAHGLVADWNSLRRIFLQPESEAGRATLLRHMEQILFSLHDFLRQNVGVTEEISLQELATQFKDTTISRKPEKKLADVITALVEDIAPHAVNVSSPYFIGHMTSAIPFFMVHLKTIVAALNQNANKIETSKVVSVIERQVIAKIHRLIFQESEEFYSEHVQNAYTTLGAFTEGGTSANMTALWVARNAAFPPRNGFLGVEADGLASAYREYEVDRCVVLVSRRGHFSLRKSGGVLGIGNSNIVAVDVDRDNRIDLAAFENKISELRAAGNVRILAAVGIAGATETGTIDPLDEMGDICHRHAIHFHVDAAWGGPTLMSQKYKHFLKGIEKADSVTIDGHKQLYMPMTCGMIFFRDPSLMDKIAYHANYVNRQGSVDLGIKTLAGSREAHALILDSALKIMGSDGYGLLIDHGIEIARSFAEEIKQRKIFELISDPVLNILTYRINPPGLKLKLLAASGDERKALIEKLNDININVQRTQRESGKSFVSRTVLEHPVSKESLVVLRSVLMNPMTDMKILNEILDEQESIYKSHCGHVYGL